jgi:hypothetical protein
MGQTFRPWDVDQQWMLPPPLHEFVPAGHEARFIREAVRLDLDLGAIPSVYEEEGGFPPFHPAMMTALLLYGYSRGVYSSRKQTVEPVFGQIRSARGFRPFLMRGLTNVNAEWAMICTAHNLLKLHKAARGRSRHIIQNETAPKGPSDVLLISR